MTVGSTTADIAMINLVVVAADGSGGLWQDPVQTIPHGMNGDPVAFIAKLQAGLPLVNNLRVFLNEYSFNPDGSLHPQMESFLSAAAAAGYQLTICYGSGAAQDIGSGTPGYPRLSNVDGYAALETNFTAMEAGWTTIMDWMDAHTAVKSAVYGWELMNESAAYRETIRYNGSGGGLTLTDFVELYTDHAIALSDLIQARADGRVLVGGWGYNGDFLTLANTMIGGQSALDLLRAGVGADLVWSAHLYPGWMETDTALSPTDLMAQLDALYAPVTGDDVLITEINADGQIDDPDILADYADYYASAYEWFADNGIGLGWYPGVQTGASHLLYLESNGLLTYRHQHSVAHAMNAFSISRDPVASAGDQAISVTLTNIKMRNEYYETQAGEGTFDATAKAGFAFGYSGNDTLTGNDQSNDFLYGGKGNDVATGLIGDDFLFGQAGNDDLSGGNGADALFGGQDHDSMDGGLGRDYLAGGSGNDTYLAVDADDFVQEYLDDGTDLVETELAAFSLAGFQNVENLTFTGTTGGAALTGNGLGNVITGGTNMDSLYGGDGDDTLNGGTGDDMLVGGLGADSFVGGTGLDCVSYETASAGVIADLMFVSNLPAAGEAAGDRFNAVERLIGSGFDDKLGGNSATNFLLGGAGNDSLWGLSGSDSLDGGTGADTMVGGTGNDTFVVDSVGDVVVELAGQGVDILRTTLGSYNISLAGLTEVDRLIYFGTATFNGVGNALANVLTGGALADTLAGGAGADTLNGGTGNDIMNGGAGADSFVGGSGTDMVVYDGASAGVIASLTTVTMGAAAGDAAGDVFSSVERLRGSSFADQLTGSSAANYLIGQAGDDTLSGLGGADRLYGGAGADQFVFGTGFGADGIYDFTNDLDEILLTGLAGITDQASAMAVATQAGADVLFTFNATTSLRVLNTTLALVGDDLIFA